MSDFLSGLLGCVFMLAYVFVWLFAFGALITIALAVFNWVF